ACSASTVLAMATVNAAKALGLEGKLGAVQAGMRADVIAVDMDCVEVWPLSNILSHLVYACGRSQVTDVWVSGKQLMRERELTTLKMDELRAIGEKWEKILREFKAGKE
ncbi:5-methylthioadenosine/S-adenosylhomocysteine deaminase, partial [Blastocystis sp. ATCC 50177/Nand II]